jgi:hypothetical protein
MSHKRYIYIAAPIGSASVANIWAETLKNELGHGIVSSWHSTIFDTTKDPHDIETRQSILARNLGDISLCDTVLALTHEGNPRATYGDIVWALAHQKLVIWRQGKDGTGKMIFDVSPRVFIATSDEAALHWLSKL